MEINDLSILSEIKSIIFHDGDSRPVWIGPDLANTCNEEYKNLAKWANEHFSLYKGFFEHVKDNSIISDLGCGGGFCSNNLSFFFKNSKINAYDIDDVSIKFANKYNKNKKIEYFKQNIVKDKLIKSDYIFLIETLEHIKHENQDELIKNCLENLNKNGLLFISTPNEQSFSNSEKGHIGILTKIYFDQFIKKYKNNLVDIEYYNNQCLLDEDSKKHVNKNNGSHFKIILKNNE